MTFNSLLGKAVGRLSDMIDSPDTIESLNKLEAELQDLARKVHDEAFNRAIEQKYRGQNGLIYFKRNNKIFFYSDSDDLTESSYSRQNDWATWEKDIQNGNLTPI